MSQFIFCVLMYTLFFVLALMNFDVGSGTVISV